MMCVFQLHASMFACRFIVVQESLSIFKISLQKVHARVHTCPSALICKLLWHPPCTNFVISKVLEDDGICRSTADVQLVGCISDSNQSVLLNQSINSFNTVRHSWSGWTPQAGFINEACSENLDPFYPLVHLPLCSTVFSILFSH
jgi:hypothetical protein